MAKEIKRQISKSWEQSQKNKIDIERVKKIEVKREDVSFNKKERRIILADDIDVTETTSSNNPLIITHVFENLPEWAIPFIKVYTRLHTTDGFEMATTLFARSSTIWKQISKNWQIKYTFTGLLVNPIFPETNPLTFFQVPLFINVEAVILNQNVWHQVQQGKT